MADKPLQIDRTVTFGLVLAVLVQTAGALLWAGAAEARLAHLESQAKIDAPMTCLLYTSPSPRDATLSRMPSSA